MMLLGPGVTEVTNANNANASKISADTVGAPINQNSNATRKSGCYPVEKASAVLTMWKRKSSGEAFWGGAGPEGIVARFTKYPPAHALGISVIRFS